MMHIPKEIRDKVRAAQILRARIEHEERLKVRPKCWLLIGEVGYKMHDHDKDGNCLLKNWSNEDPKGNWRKAK